jgi:hypothetical protein
VIAVQMDRLSHISVSHDITAIKERHHRRNSFNLTPCPWSEALSRVTHRTRHRVHTARLLLEGYTHRRCTLAGRERGELTGRQHSEWRARSRKAHTQWESVTNRCGEREAPPPSRGRKATTDTTWVLELSTATGISRGGHDRMSREANRTSCANEVNTPPFERLAQSFKCVTPEFTNLIKQQEATMRPGELARHHAGTAADEPRYRDVVMRRSQRWTYWEPDGVTSCRSD